MTWRGAREHSERLARRLLHPSTQELLVVCTRVSASEGEGG